MFVLLFTLYAVKRHQCIVYSIIIYIYMYIHVRVRLEKSL